MTKLGSGKLHICPKVTKMGSIVGHRVDYNRVTGSERPAGHTQQILTQVPPPPRVLGETEEISTGNSMICSDIWHEYHE